MSTDNTTSTDDNTASNSKVTVYTTPTCGFCHMVKNYLDGKEVAYEAIDISQDEECYKVVLENTVQLGVPVPDFDFIVIVGFDRTNIDMALKDKSLA